MAQSWRLLGGCTVLALPSVLHPASSVAEPAYLLGLGLVVVALWCAVGRAVGGARRPWTLLATAATCWFLGDVVHMALERLDRAPEGVGVPDLFWLGSYPLLVAAISGMVRARGLPPDLLREIRLDVVVVSAAAGVAAWHLLVVPALRDEGTTAYRFVSAAYPLGDVTIFALALTLLMVPGRKSTAAWLLIACLGFTLPLDLLQIVVPVLDADFDAARLDGALLVVNGLLAGAALHPSRHELTRPVVLAAGHTMHSWRVVLLGASLCTVSVVSELSDSALGAATPFVAATVLTTVVVVVRFYLVVRDRELGEARLLHAATHDQLTGAANRQLLMQRLTATVRTSRAGGPALIFLDLDGFKAINDSLGHAAGDLVLQEVARRLRYLFRPSDTVARLGGDEFVVLVDDIDPRDAAALGDRVRAAIMAPIPALPDAAAIGASVGVLTALPRSHGADALLRRADAAMYEAKRHGGGVVTLGPGDDRLVARPSGDGPATVEGRRDVPQDA